MITAGKEQKEPDEWAEQLAPASWALDPFKHALRYIDRRGWFDNTFESRGALKSEIERVLNLRVRFGKVDDWDEFPFPSAWAVRMPSPVPLMMAKPKLSLKEQRERFLQNLVASERRLRTNAINYLTKHAPESYSSEQTVCYMWKLNVTSPRWMATGSGFKVTDLRKKHGVPLGKETICAEEAFLTKYGVTLWFVSASYDLKHGWKYACQKGCEGLLAKLGIIDLAGDLHVKAGGVESWSKIPS